MGDEDRCAACGALIEYEVHINPDGEGTADGRRYCSVGCAAAGQAVPDETQKRAAKEGGKE